MRNTVREAVVVVLGAVGLTALVVGHGLVVVTGFAVCALAAWQLTKVRRPDAIGVDQRAADRERPPNLHP